MAQSRRMLVLRAVVEDYIRSQEPVGSTTLTRIMTSASAPPPCATTWRPWKMKAI